MIRRDLANAIKDNLLYFPIVTITGPRQSGKTTLIRDMFPDLPYFSLENPDTRALAMTDPTSFLSQHNVGMILDEVQNTLKYCRICKESWTIILNGNTFFRAVRNSAFRATSRNR